MKPKQELGIIFLIFVSCSAGVGYYSAIKDIFHFSPINWLGLVYTIGMIIALIYALIRADEILKVVP